MLQERHACDVLRQLAFFQKRILPKPSRSIQLAKLWFFERVKRKQSYGQS
eukprot:m.144390 g.144390  ORF g.144390 m.144390 type:complete len:50 (+) comp38401_c0_seq75:2126-2275(+)